MTADSAARMSHDARVPQGDPLSALLRGDWIDPDTGASRGIDIAAIAIEPSLRGREADLVAALGFGPRIAVLCDPDTREALGARVEAALAGLGRVEAVRLPRDPHPDLETVEAVRNATMRCDAIVAVGSGTINDLAKLAAARDGKPWAVFATAPSMNGYTSANAAITVGGHKKSLPASLARGVFVDLEVLAAAPPRMIRAGLGDSLARSTAQVDWLLSRALHGTLYQRAPFAMLAADESALFEAPEALMRGDVDAMRALARTLLLSGIGMTLAGGSHPASQGEHLVSHYLDMRASAGAPSNLHGEQVAVATLAMARLQQAMLDGPAPAAGPTRMSVAALRAHFGGEVGDACWRDFAPKRLDESAAAALTERIAERWEAFRREAATILVPASTLASVMRRAGGPLDPRDLGLDDRAWANALTHARFLRDRYTFLDLADDAGRLAAFAAT
ncbi:MAG: iron-containing alcohol dehydrogenase [Betaproteobacteria bacterium PRO3]|nr:iron-containing alcohol dehydrogenase [Betaproteobacteria bacterium PRO3]